MSAFPTTRLSGSRAAACRNARTSGVSTPQSASIAQSAQTKVAPGRPHGNVLRTTRILTACQDIERAAIKAQCVSRQQLPHQPFLTGGVAIEFTHKGDQPRLGSLFR